MKAIHVLRKPCSESTVAANVLRHGTGAMNIDGCRVGLAKNEDVDTLTARSGGERGIKPDGYVAGSGARTPNLGWDCSKGRWPANVVFQHAPGCRQTGTRTVGTGSLVPGDAVHRTSTMLPVGAGWNGNILDNSKKNAPNSYGTETVAAYECAPGCPVAALDEQSGVRTSGKPSGIRGKSNHVVRYADVAVGSALTGYGDSGGASRFFKQFGGESA